MTGRTVARLCSLACGVGAAVAGSASLVALLTPHGERPVEHFLALHVVGAALCGASSRLRRVAMRDARAGVTVLVPALCVPVFGPALAWTFVREVTDAPVVDAHQGFEHDEQQSQPWRGAAPVAAASPWSDGVQAYTLVLRDSDLERRRKLLRRLAELGEPTHLAVLRRCLHDAEPEVRLCAYGELQKLCRVHEDRIAELQEAVDAAPGRNASAGQDAAAAEALCEVAAASFDYARSGLLDVDMARYWTQQAAKVASQALDLDPDNWRAAQVHALAGAALGDPDEAVACLDASAAQDRPELLLARCAIEFERRDFDAVRRHARELDQAGHPLPTWLSELVSERLPGAIPR